MDIHGLSLTGCSCSGACRGVIALNMEDGSLHRFRAMNTILATGVRLFSAFTILTRMLVGLFYFSVSLLN